MRGFWRLGRQNRVIFHRYEQQSCYYPARKMHYSETDSGVSNHRGEHSAVLVTDEPRAIISPDREKVRQQGRRIKEPNEPMFTITAQDRHGIIHHGRIRKLMPIECWRLQGFTDEQFYKAAATGLSDGRLYKMAATQ